MKRINLLLTLLPLLLLLSCGGNVDIDNAGEEALKVTIDGQLYLLKAGARENIKLEQGLHSIQVADIKNEILRDTVFQLSKGGLLNVARAEYLIWKDVFSPESTLAFRKEVLNTQELKIDRKIYQIDYEALAPYQIYVESKWDYGLGEDFPTKVYGWEIDKDQKYMIKTKLVRLDEFEKTYLKALQGGGN